MAYGRAPMTEPPLITLSRWESYGAIWRAKSITPDEAIVELCSCHGEPVDELRSADPELLTYLLGRPDSTCEPAMQGPGSDEESVHQRRTQHDEGQREQADTGA